VRASRRNLAIIVGILAVLAIAGAIVVRLGLGETDEPLPDFGDAGAAGALKTAAGPVAAGARPLLDDGGVPAGMSRIAGTVRDLARAPVAGVEVRFTGAAGEASATSDGAGARSPSTRCRSPRSTSRFRPASPSMASTSRWCAPRS
jgi:hypothetical protein